MEKKILIVEDERKIADTLKFGLNEKGFNVDVAYDGNVGYRLFSANDYDHLQMKGCYNPFFIRYLQSNRI